MIGKRRNALLLAHQANIDRYQRILGTQLTTEERRFAERFLAEQQAALKQREFFVECLLSSLPAHVPPAESGGNASINSNRKTASRRSLRNPSACFDQAAGFEPPPAEALLK